MKGIWPILLLVFLLPALLGAGGDSRTGYRIIVNQKNPMTAIDRTYLSEIFLKKVRYWPQRNAIKPADLTTESSVRRQFTEDVLNRSVGSIKNYWQQRIFSGRDVPPPELETDRQVIDFVSKNVGGIGYVSNSANIRKVKVVGVK